MPAIGLYPLSTQGGQAIPLDIVKPVSMVRWAMVANDSQNITIPAGSIAWVYSTVDAIISIGAGALPDAPVSGTNYAGAIFVPAGAPTTIVITPGDGKLVSFTDGTFYLNVVEQWAALTQDRQSSIG